MATLPDAQTVPHSGPGRDQTQAVGAAGLDALEAFVRAHPRLLVLSGAGVSTESGIPDYRDRRGVWKHAPPLLLQQFLGSEGDRRRYWGRSLLGWPRVATARPNAAHRALAKMERGGWIELLVTQNVDGLHQRAGSHAVVDLHGRLDTVSCLRCQHILPRQEFQSELAALNPHLSSLEADAAPDGDARATEQDWSTVQIPPCRSCGTGLLKPDVVFFGDAVPPQRIERAMAALGRAQALLVVGSSLMVFSGFRFCREAARIGKPIAVVNLGRTRADHMLALKVEVACGAILPALVSRLQVSHVVAGPR
jgi:NAD-dependent SIR2 family protein deacetylase